MNWPIRTHKEKILITSPFSIRWGQLHKGIDISTHYGENVYPAHNGVVVFAGKYKGYGNLIIISHLNKYTTYYAHLSTLNVKKGMKVTEKNLIVKTGESGSLTGPTLHFELREDDVPVDPLIILPKNYHVKIADKHDFEKIHNG